MNKVEKILIVDDDDDFRRLVSTHLKNIYENILIDEYDLSTKRNFPSESECSNYDVMLLDHDLRLDQTGVSWFKSCKKVKGFPATIMITSLANETMATHALNSGVHYYLNKQKLSKEVLKNAVNLANEIKQSRLKIVNEC